MSDDGLFWCFIAVMVIIFTWGFFCGGGFTRSDYSYSNDDLKTCGLAYHDKNTGELKLINVEGK